MELRINDRLHAVDAAPDTPLLWVLRDDLGMTGTKYGCGIAQCGACSVLVDGVVTRACVTPVDSVAGKQITTIEAVEQDAVGARVVQAWIKHQVPQCGYCQSGQVIAATALLKEVAQPSDAEIAAAMVNLCRCGTYNAIRAAVQDLAGATPAAAVDAGAPGDIAAAALLVAGAAAVAAAKPRDGAA
ncbi:(2Fe-2S)-binding protein [Sphingomonas sp. R1]|uniref:(2Fe-2S)-binding protein n=1 Tax=Sphingomonas sp. R1 TaxID=399176 RepID=UPI002225AB64|nr:(2Fe-2S)-binding protein [Sphingomonas sp. R1]UYY78497.1 (2Fe-2S)-binding protein [Sphingomonas sp. R1]